VPQGSFRGGKKKGRERGLDLLVQGGVKSRGEKKILEGKGDLPYQKKGREESGLISMITGFQGGWRDGVSQKDGASGSEGSEKKRVLPLGGGSRKHRKKRKGKGIS